MALGNPTVVYDGVLADSSVPDASVSFNSTVSGTSTADTSGVIIATGFKGIVFKVVYATYRGTFRIQGSYDNSTFVDICPNSSDAVAQSYTWYWQTFHPWAYYRIIADPNGSNAGTATVTARLVSRVDNQSDTKTGFTGPNGFLDTRIASADYTAEIAQIDFVTKGPGFRCLFNVTAKGGGALKFNFWHRDPTTGKIGGQGIGTSPVLLSAAINETNLHTYVVYPPATAVANAVVGDGGHYWALTSTLYDSGTYTFPIVIESLD